MSDLEERVAALEHLLCQLLSRQLASTALTMALINRAQAEALPGILEEYDAACDRLAAELPPHYQQPQHWQELSEILEERIRALRAAGKPPSS